MRRWAWLWISLLLVAVVGATCGAAPRRGYSPVYGEKYGKAKGYSPGQGGAATWDTVTVIFSPETLVDAAIDTFGYPTSGQIAADLTRVHYLNDVLLGRNGQGSPATFIKLGAGGVTSFAYANISNYSTTAADTFGYIHGSADRIMLQSATSFVTDGVRVLDLSFPQILRKSEFVYIPFENYIPANSTIVSATMNVSSASAPMLLTHTDSIIAQPLHPAWDKWMLVKDVGANDNVAHAAWTSQESTGPAGAWGGTTRYPWVPDLDYLPKLWDVSKVSDWTTNITANVPEKSNFPISLTNTVQHFVNGNPNTGFMVNLADIGSFTMSIQYFKWDAGSSNAPRRHPAVIVKYITKRYQKPYGSGDWAFLLATDDAIKACNDSIATIIQNRGMKFTVNAAYAFVGDAGFGDAADLLRWHDMGVEIASHTRGHPNPLGMNTYSISALPYEAADTTGAAWDSLTTQMSPEWMYSLADSMGRDMRSSPIYAKSIALPNNTWNPWVVKLAGQIGYKALRVGSMNPVSVNGALGMYAPATRGAAYTDTARVSFGTMYQRAPRNMTLLPTTQVIQQVVGLKANTTITEAQVKNNMARAAFQSKGDGRNALHMFFHDFKTAPTNAGYTEGVDPEEVRWLLDVVTEYGGRTMTQSEFTTWNMATAIPIDTPPDMLQDDLFRFQAHENVWYKPDGLDNRWIRGLRNRAAASSFDVTAPPAPASALAYGQNGSVVLTWPPSATGEPVSYRIYRFFDNAADTVLVATSNSTFYVDGTAVNGSPHNYYVTAVDAAGNESAPTATIATTPGTIRSLTRPAYWAFWYQDPADDVALAQADVEKLAAFDMIVGSPHSLEGPELGEVGFDGLLGRIRAINPDAIYLTYYTAFCMYNYWADSPPLSVHKRVWEYAATLPDSAGLGKDVAGNVVRGDFYPGQVYNNVMIPTMADTIAKFLLESYEGKGTDGEWAGFFLDDSDTTLSDWMCNNYACGDTLDFDQDGTVYNSDADEKAAFKEWHLRLVRAIRREFAERGMQNRLVTANTTWGRKDDPSPKDEQYMGLLDGMLNEAWNLYWPGPNIPTDTAKWDLTLDWRTQLTHAQTSPPLVMWNARSDSSAQYMNEVLAYANGGLVNANSGNDWSSDSSAPTIGRKNPRLNPGLNATAYYDTVAGNATADTLRAVTSSGLVARMVMSRAVGDIDNQYAVWPYLITNAAGDTIISRSFYWPLPEDVGPPASIVQIDDQASVGGDRYARIAWGVNRIPGDFLGWYIYRSPCDDCPDDPLLEALPSVTVTGDLEYAYVDSSVTNGEEYTYLVAAVDANLNVGVTGESDPLTPYDDTAPSIPSNLKASGGSYYVDLDWNNSQAADLVGYQVNRALDNDGAPGAFAITDSVSISAHQDSTALSANTYYYFVRSFDDDGNISAPSDTVSGGWVGLPTPPEFPVPQQIIVRPDYPVAGRAQILVVAPSDTTGTGGITGYQVFRSASEDTASADLYRTGIVPDVQFASGIYEDLKANSDPDTTWYYTAKVLYDEGWSEKFHTPRPGLTTGNYPSTVPIVQPIGQTGGIAVYWSFLSGSDSTLVYRGTSAESQALIATVAHGANPYNDTTALANTNYYYKVRHKDNPSTYTSYSAVYGPVSWVSVPSGNPAISGVNEGVDNTVQHGEEVVIAGSSFGTNNVDTDIWDDMENGTYSASWEGNLTGWPLGTITVAAAGANARHTNSAYNTTTNFRGTDYLEHATRKGGQNSSSYFAQYWFKLDNDWNWGTGSVQGVAPYNLSNVKLFRMWTAGENDITNEDFIVATHGWNNQIILSTENISPTTAEFVSGYQTAWTKGTWHCFQFEFVESSVGAADGWFKMYVDGLLYGETTNMETREDSSALKRVYGLGFFNTSGDPSTDDNHVYFDDFYINPSLARVEIGNASTYAACTHREIQIPTAWTASSVTVTANTGSFTDAETVYLFVIDADGTASAGVEIDIDNP